MVMKGVIQEDHMPANKGTLKILGLPGIDFTTISGPTFATTEVELPDATVVSGGKRGPWEMTVTVPIHHLVQIVAMDLWVEDGKNGKNGYKKSGSMIFPSVSGDKIKTYSLLGVWARDLTLPDQDMANDGDMNVNTYVLRGDDALPV